MCAFKVSLYVDDLKDTGIVIEHAYSSKIVYTDRS